jgi:hypothetical protein
LLSWAKQSRVAELRASRGRGEAAFQKLTGFLHAHHIWDGTIYSYALMHNDAAALREWLKHHDQFAASAGRS